MDVAHLSNAVLTSMKWIGDPCLFGWSLVALLGESPPGSRVTHILHPFADKRREKECRCPQITYSPLRVAPRARSFTTFLGRFRSSLAIPEYSSNV